MDATEVEFLAEKELVTIIPNFSLDKIYLIGGDLGPFDPGLPVDVPLWLAVSLKQRQKCRLLPPPWMDAAVRFSFCPRAVGTRVAEGTLSDFTCSSLVVITGYQPAPLRPVSESLLGFPQAWSSGDIILALLCLQFVRCPLSSEPDLIYNTFLKSQVVWITYRIKEKLEKIRDHERKEETFTPVPSPYYMELSKLLLKHASDNIPRADAIRTLIKDLWDTRMAKLRVSADSFVRQQEAHAKLDNLTLMEINTSGAFLTEALRHMYKLRTNLQPSESTTSQDF